MDRLRAEALLLFGAGTITTARTLDFMVYYIAANDSIRSTLNDELKDIMAQYPEIFPSLTQLEKLPYLTAVIKEGLRYVLLFLHKGF